MTQNWLENNIIYIRPFSCSMRARRKVTPAPPYIGRVEDMVTASPALAFLCSPCQQDRGHTRMSKSERRNCWNYTFNFHQAGSQWWGSGPVSPGPPHTGRAGCLLLCNGQQDTRFKLMHHNGTPLSIISTPGPRVKNRAPISNKYDLDHLPPCSKK